jgi:AAA+ ATPase superfamily predicted ATPase
MAVGVEFSVMLGVALGVAFGVQVGVEFSVAASVEFGVAVGMMTGVTFGVARGMRRGMLVGAVVGVVGAVVVGVAAAVAIDVAAGAVVVVVASVASTVTITHLQVLPFQWLLSSVLWVIIRFNSNLSPSLWRFSPVRWDEIIILPLPGLVGFLVTLNRSDPALGQEAIAQVAAHRFQRPAALKALVRIAREEALLITSLPALAAFERGLDWVEDRTDLPKSLQSVLPRMRDISREVASARESDSVTNKVRRLATAAEMLESLRKQPGEFGAALARWSPIIAAGLEEAERQKQLEEPIPQAYTKDGKPIRPAGRPETALPFKGRATLFRQLEAALGGSEGERTTFMLYGQRRTGKTSALLQLPRRLGSQVVPAFLDLQSPTLGGANDVAGLLSGLAAEVREETRRYRSMQLPAIDPAALAHDPFPEFGRWLDKVEKALGERMLLLCLDEFETLEDAISRGRFDTRILSTIRNIVQHRRRIAVLLSGSHQISELPPHWASALITTTTLRISFLEEADARELIERPVADFPSIYDPAAVDRIIELTHCQPYLVQLTCALLVDRMNAARRMPPQSFVTKEDVEAVIPAVLAQGQSYFTDLWHTQTGSDLARRVVVALADAPGERLDREAMLRIERDALKLSEAINGLLRREIIERSGDGYRITVPLVTAYVRQEIVI